MIIMKDEEEDGENAYDDGVLNWGNTHQGTSADDDTSEINNGADAQSNIADDDLGRWEKIFACFANICKISILQISGRNLSIHHC